MTKPTPKLRATWTPAHKLMRAQSQWLSKQLGFAPGRVNPLEGVSGTLKTWLLYDFGFCVAAGLPAWGGAVTIDGYGPCALADYEMGDFVRPRLDQVAGAHGRLLSQADVRVLDAPPKLTHPSALDYFTDAMDGVAVLLVDSKRAGSGRVDGNDGAAVEAYDTLRAASTATGCTVLIVDHDGWGNAGHARGHSGFRGESGTAIGVQRTGNRITLSPRKVSHAEQWAPITLSARFDAAGFAGFESTPDGDGGEIPGVTTTAKAPRRTKPKRTRRQAGPKRADADIERDVRAYLDAHPGASQREVECAVQGARARVRAAYRCAVGGAP